VTDPDDKSTKFTYDAFGDLISMTDPKFGATTFAYFAVPEPSTWAAMLLGFAGLAFAGRLRARKTSLVNADFWPQQAVKARCRPARP
jgi:YD repeat-containing protein